MRPIAGLCLACMLFCALSCGGGSGSGIAPTVTIDWPARSRDISPPVSALSVNVQIQGVGAININRLDNFSAFSKTYTLPFALSGGLYNVTATAYAQEDGTGSIVGTSSTTAQVSASAPTLGSFAMTGVTASVAVIPSQTVLVGSTIALTATALDGSGTDLMVTPGSITWKLNTLTGSVTLTPDGQLKALAAGIADVTATVDGITSPAVTVTAENLPTGTCGNSLYVPNYVDEMETSQDPTFAGNLMHWTSFPVTIQVVQNSSLTTNFQTLLQQAMTAWTNALGGRVTFTLVTGQTNPDVSVTFQPSSQIGGGDAGDVGLTTTTPISTGSLVIGNSVIQIASDLDDNTMTLNTLCHEFGHALGIEGHSTTPEDLMYPYLNDDFMPTSDDVNTLLTAYCGSFPTGAVKRSFVRPTGKPITVADKRAPGP